jgi:hypothetical protein
MWLNKLRVTLFDRDGAFLSDDHIVHDKRFWFDGIDPDLQSPNLIPVQSVRT